MRTMNAGEFKAKCLRILDEVATTGEPVLILKRGTAVTRLLPPLGTDAGYPQDSLPGTGRILGDIVAPAAPSDW